MQDSLFLWKLWLKEERICRQKNCAVVVEICQEWAQGNGGWGGGGCNS